MVTLNRGLKFFAPVVVGTTQALMALCRPEVGRCTGKSCFLIDLRQLNWWLGTEERSESEAKHSTNRACLTIGRDLVGRQRATAVSRFTILEWFWVNEYMQLTNTRIVFAK